MLDGPAVAGIVLAAGAVLAGGYYYVAHHRDSRAAASNPRSAQRLPLFAVDDIASGRPGSRIGSRRTAQTDGSAPARSRPPITSAGSAQGSPLAPRTPPVSASASNGATGGSIQVGSSPPQTSRAPMPLHTSAAPSVAVSERHAPAMSAPTGVDSPFDGETIRFAVPEERTLQFLPGRLQIVSGPESGREIRFVRSPDSPTTDVTFGRSEGVPFRHVQLLARTVSRRHATMALLDGHWSLQNHSATNPVLVNGRALAPDETVPLLVDGDRIEMGEIAFVYGDR